MSVEGRQGGGSGDGKRTWRRRGRDESGIGVHGCGIAGYRISTFSWVQGGIGGVPVISTNGVFTASSHLLTRNDRQGRTGPRSAPASVCNASCQQMDRIQTRRETSVESYVTGADSWTLASDGGGQ